MLVSRVRSVLLIVDAQERLAPAVSGGEACIERCRVLLEAARRLDVPVLATEHYPQGIGPLVPRLRTLVPAGRIFEKIRFCAADCPDVLEALGALDREQVVIGGMEAHVCVLQSALGLAARGFQPVVVADAVASRDPAERERALRRLEAHGIDVASSEMVVFEWLERGDTDAFRAILPLITQRDAP